MDSKRVHSSTLPNLAARPPAQHDSPEQLIDVFKAAALSVTKLYKTSALAESKARGDGYRDCLEDLLAYLDKENLGLTDGEGWSIRRWLTEKLDGRDAGLQVGESEDENDKPETTTADERDSDASQQPASTRGDSAPPTSAPANNTPPSFIVPTQDAFTFQSSHQYPNIATLDLSDTRSFDGPTITSSRSTKARSGKSGSRSGHLGRGAGTKRRMDFDDFFGGCLGGKDPFGNGPKRNRHA